MVRIVQLDSVKKIVHYTIDANPNTTTTVTNTVSIASSSSNTPSTVSGSGGAEVMQITKRDYKEWWVGILNYIRSIACHYVL